MKRPKATEVCVCEILQGFMTGQCLAHSLFSLDFQTRWKLLSPSCFCPTSLQLWVSAFGLFLVCSEFIELDMMVFRLALGGLLVNRAKCESVWLFPTLCTSDEKSACL